MRLLLYLLLLPLNLFSQFLSLSEGAIVHHLASNNITFDISSQNDCDIITTTNTIGYICIYEFDKDDICKKETIITNTAEELAGLIMDLNTKHYIRLNDIFYHEEEYGLVEVRQYNNKFIYTYK